MVNFNHHKERTKEKADMNTDTPSKRLPTLISEFFTSPSECFDNIFSESWKSLNMNHHIRRSGFTKRSGLGISEAVFLLLIWKWINVNSICMFARQSLGCFANASKDVMYDLLKRPDVNWRKFNLLVAAQIHKSPAIKHSQTRTFVLDDSVKTRRGKKWRACPATLIIPKVGMSWASRS
ncbi:hypothetical protein [Reinekea marinisedimentorum]|uniref:DDE superfamily endonuclease n=1 Tax=Reinekea marinisedimentorum TaxID=230495 RepID=A0A4R3HUD3_9GAMM|nr:hypothetical protein [Reinekea marinisedimentorum]TCS36712.1 hypothetical protein BCF53_12336 [Reinekea marinisedimentorum]